MRLKKIRVEGFQSFSDSAEVEFEEGFNLIIGQNNSGKSALLRAMLPYIPDDRHRTPERWEDGYLPPPKISLTIEASGVEIKDWIMRRGGAHQIPVSQNQINEVVPVMERLWKEKQIGVDLFRSTGTQFNSEYPAVKHFVYEPGSQRACALVNAQSGMLQISPLNADIDAIPDIFWDAWTKHMFHFDAERLKIGDAPHGYAARLVPNASNLPNVLHTLLNERGSVFRKLIEHLIDIFPTVGNVSIRTRPDNNHLEIRIWPTPTMEQPELSFPLNSSGTGVAQAMAILAAIMTVDNAVIIIDEINTFLHPAAVKALLRILQTQYSQHQYIISSHAPEVIGFSNTKTIHLVKRDGYESKVERLNLDRVDEFRDVAQHLGVSMADVFAADRVIWVEGATEEVCFPYIYQAFSGHPVPRGTMITAVTKTGDFNRKRDREIVYEVYNRLSRAAATLVVATMFSFDTEELGEADKEKMINDSGGRLIFLPRRHIECYLLDPEAIANIIIAKDPSSADVVTSDAVTEKLAELAGNQKFKIAEWSGNADDPIWQAKVDAAKLVEQAVSEISENRATFQKKKDTLTLIQDIVARDKEVLRPLFEYVDRLVRRVSEN